MHIVYLPVNGISSPLLYEKSDAQTWKKEKEHAKATYN